MVSALAEAAECAAMTEGPTMLWKRLGVLVRSIMHANDIRDTYKGVCMLGTAASDVLDRVDIFVDVSRHM